MERIWERRVDAGAWGDLSDGDRWAWNEEVWRRHGHPKDCATDDNRACAAASLLPLRLWRTLDALGQGLRVFGKVAGAC